MKLLSPAPSGRTLRADAMMQHLMGPGVICVEAARADILTAAAQLLSGDSLLVGCGYQLPIPGGISVSTKPSRRRHTRDRVIAVSAHCLRTRDRCNSLLNHCGDNTLLILLIATGTEPPHWIDVDARFQMTPRNPAEPPGGVPPLAMYRGAAVPARQLRLCVARKADDIAQEPLPQYAGEDGATPFKIADGTEAMLWAGLTVRAGVSPMLQRSAGVSPGLIGVIEQFGEYGSPIVRFANMAVVLMSEEGDKQQLPLTPCNHMVTVRDLQELPRLPPGWVLERMEGVNIGPISHLLI